MNLALEDNQPRATISLAQFQAAIKKKQNKKNEIQQILDFNLKKTQASKSSNSQTHQPNIQLSADSEFDLNQWKKSDLAVEKHSFFQEEGNKLLGQEKSTKHIKGKFLIIDLLLHLCLAIIHFSKDQLMLMIVGDLIIMAFETYLLTDRCLMIKEQPRLGIYKTYKYALLLSIFCLLINIVLFFFSTYQKFQMNYLWVFGLSFGGIGCEKKLWSTTSKTVFMIEQINKKESPQDFDLSDDL